MNKFAFLCFLALGLSACYLPKSDAESEKIKFIQADDLKADLISLHQTLKKFHPALYRYTQPEVFEKKFVQTYQKLHSPQTRLDFYRAINSYLSEIKCGHTTVHLPNRWETEENNPYQVLPFQIQIIDNQIFIVENFSSAIDLPVATQLLSVQGQSAQKIIQTLQNNISNLSDGYNLTGKTRYIEKNFAWIYPIFFPYKHSVYTFEFAFSNPQHIAKVDLQLIDYQLFKKLSTPSQEEILKLDILNNFQTAILKIKSFDQAVIQGKNQNFNAFMDSTFQVLKNKRIQHLILDVRNNTGGDDDNMAYLLRYLIPKEFKIYERIEVTPDYKGYGKILPVNSKQFLNMSSKGLESFLPLPNYYEGKLWLLQNGASFSATAEMLAILKENKIGKRIGEESGGGMSGNTSGLIHNLTLKNTGLKVRIPQWAYYLAVSNPTQSGVNVDFEVSLKPEDLKNQVDSALREAFELIQKESDRQ